MLRNITVFFVLLNVSLAVHSQEQETDEACAMMICLSTDNLKLGGQPCVQAQRDFFEIVKYKKVGFKNKLVPDIPKTIQRRRDRLKKCDGARSSDVEQIMAVYGPIIKPNL